MQVRMRAEISGTRNGSPWPAAGEVVTVDDAEGARLCASGVAEPVAAKPDERAEKAVPSSREEQRKSGKRRATHTE